MTTASLDHYTKHRSCDDDKAGNCIKYRICYISGQTIRTAKTSARVSYNHCVKDETEDYENCSELDCAVCTTAVYNGMHTHGEQCMVHYYNSALLQSTNSS